ncbi:MAG: NAD(P)-binding protein [Candidatus Magnetominusculus sp. LBB02]|nr:NAD(P)-binding protein [Candidatus Magnetominusculus sp. LBB02]
MKRASVIGGGIAGISIAHLLSKAGWQTSLFERNAFLGGGFKTFYCGGHPYTLGPRPFMSRNEGQTHLFEYLNGIIPMRKLNHNMLSYIERDGQFYSYPISADDIAKMPDAGIIEKELKEGSAAPPENFEEFWLSAIGPTLYGKFIDKYSKKMWQLESNTELKEFKWSPKGHTLKTGGKSTHSEAIVSYPYAYDGYDQYFTKCTEDVAVHLSCNIENVDLDKREIIADGSSVKSDIIVNTISPDELMGNCYGPLPYLGRDFIKVVLPVKEIFPDDVQFVYYPNDEKYLRIVEYKKLTFYESPSTLILMEVVSSKGKLYPLPFPGPKQLAKKYMDAMPANIYNIGRLGTYTYNIDMEGILLQALDLMRRL